MMGWSAFWVLAIALALVGPVSAANVQPEVGKTYWVKEGFPWQGGRLAGENEKKITIIADLNNDYYMVETASGGAFQIRKSVIRSDLQNGFLTDSAAAATSAAGQPQEPALKKQIIVEQPENKSLGISLLALFVVSVLIGCQAQISKGRTGAAWGFLTFVVLFSLFYIFWPDGRTLHQASPEERENLATAVAVFGQAGFAATIAIIIGGIAMSLIVTTLPDRREKSSK